MLMCSLLIARETDPELPQNSLRLEVGGKSLGIGFTFERAWRNQNKTKHPLAFNSAEVNVGYAGSGFIITSAGINRNRYAGIKRSWVISCGLAGALRISTNPTPKEMRDYYDSTQIYSGQYINPIEPLLLGNVSCRYTFNRIFLQASFVPVLYYDRAYNRGFLFWPWGGLSVGINLKKDE
jgi:hypothetical protein